MADLQATGLIGVGTDHAGVALKNEIVTHLRAAGYAVEDFGAHSTAPCDYPDIAIRIGEAVRDGAIARGILVCGTGIGMSVAANKVAGVRAALCTNRQAAELSRTHNDANVLVLAGRDGEAEEPLVLVDCWLTTAFSGEARHVRRLRRIAAYEAAPPPRPIADRQT